MRVTNRLKSESGFTMIATIIGVTVIMGLALVTVTAVRGDLGSNSYDLNRKKAYEAAQAGINDYAFRLYTNRDYWKSCDTIANDGVNQQGSTTKRRSVPGNTGATWAVELLPATGQSTCSTSAPDTSMIEIRGEMAGSFRIRSTGFSGRARASIVATFRRGSFLDYIYFTQLETSDPITYADEDWLDDAYVQCSKTIAQGRYSSSIPNSGGVKCNVISFISADTINGPLHTNDALVICGDPNFGRSATDVIEVSSPPLGWYSTDDVSDSSSCNGNPDFIGTFITNAPTLTPPSTNSQLATIAQSQFKYTGQVRICLSGTNMTVGTGSSCTGTYSGAIPSNGVIYVANGSCSTVYSPFTATYPSTSGCGNVYVEGSYSGALTIAAENDIIVKNDLIRSSNGILGLIANNFVRVYHPFCANWDGGTPSCTDTTAGTADGKCNGGENGTGTQDSMEIDAAILAINHSFIVDHYNCGEDLDTLSVEGAIAQKFRGPVGTLGGTGYAKNYVYDDRLRYIEPPNFIEPTELPWRIGRETAG
jgi:hypothetical protein